MNEIPDDRLDALLRDVAAPASLAARLKEITNPSDDELDQLLCGVAMPEHLTMQLQAIPEDELLADELLDVQPPFTLRGELQFVTPADTWQRTRRDLGQMATAACLFLAISITLGTSAAAYLSSVYPPADEPQWVVLAPQPANIQAEFVSLPEPTGHVFPEEAPRTAELIALDEPPAADQMLLDNWDESVLPVSTTGPLAQWQALLRSGLRPMDDVVLMRWGLLGAPQYSEDEMPELIRLPEQKRSGLELPLVRVVDRRDYDRRFWLKEGINPPISPAAHEKLQRLEIPLNTSTATLDSAVAALALGKLPDRDEVRVEHFLAGLESRFPAAPRGQLALHVQGSPSPFGANDAYLLQLGVQAGKLRQQNKVPTHLVIAVDISASMARGARMDMVRNAVQQAHRQLSSKDALSLVAFEEGVVCRVEHLRVNQGQELREQLLELLPRGGTNLAAGLQAAASVALTQPAGEQDYRTRLVLITDSRAAMPDNTTTKISEVMTLIGDNGVSFDVFDVSGRSQSDPLLAEFTQELGGSYRAIHTRQQLFSSLVESLAGQSPAVAAEARLTIRFNKDTVAAYRLLGHEPNLLATVVPASVDAQLLPEEASGALLEIWFKNNASASDLGQVSVTWKDPLSGARQERKTTILRSHFAASFGETPASLQTAAVAAEIAEQFRGSREALRPLLGTQGRNNDAATIRTAIRSWSLTLRQEPDLHRLLLLLDQLEKAQKARRL